MKKTTVWLALLAFCGTNTPVAADNTNTLSIDTDSIQRYWDVDEMSHTITSNDLLEDGSHFDSDNLLKIFNNLDAVIQKKYQDYKINLGKKFLSHYQEKTIDLSPIAKYIHRINDDFLADAYRLENFDTTGFTNVTKIGNNFLNSAYNLKNLDTQGFTNVTKIGDGFLSGAESLTKFDASGLSSLEKIGTYFLAGAKALTKFDTSGLSSLEKIGNSFLVSAHSLQTLDTSGFTNITEIGNSFLSGAHSLQTLDTSGFKNVKKIGDDFFSRAHSLQTLDTRGFANVTEIGNNFLANAHSLQKLDAQGLKKVKKIGDNFLKNTISLKEFNKSELRLIKEGENFRSGAISTPHSVSIDTDSIDETYWTVDPDYQTITNNAILKSGSQFDSVTLLKIFNNLDTVIKKKYQGYKINLSKFFLEDYAGETIDLSPIAKYISCIEEYFLLNACRLTEFNTAKLTNLKRIGNYFLNNAYSLKSLDTQVFTNVTNIGRSFMANAESLVKLDMEGFRNVTVIGAYFLNRAKKLKTLINMHLLKELKNIKYSFLCGAHSLQTLDTSGFTNVTEIEYDFLADAISLEKFDAQGLINVTKVGKNFLADAISLEKFDARGFSKVTKVGNNFLHHALATLIIVPSSHYTAPFLLDTLPSSSALNASLNKALTDFVSSRSEKYKSKKYKVMIMSNPQDSPKTAHLKTPQRVAGLPDSNVEISEKDSNKIRITINVKKRTKKELDKQEGLLDKMVTLCGNQQLARNNTPENVFVDTKEESKQEESKEKKSKKNSRDLADNPSVMDDESMEEKSVKIFSFMPYNLFFRP